MTRVTKVTEDKCKGVPDAPPRAPHCSPDLIEGWFLRLKSAVSAASEPGEVLCIMKRAREAKRRCSRYPFTGEFIPTAYEEVMDLAEERLESLEDSGRGRSEGGVIHFSSGEPSHSSLEAIEEQLREERLRRHRTWF